MFCIFRQVLFLFFTIVFTLQAQTISVRVYDAWNERPLPQAFAERGADSLRANSAGQIIFRNTTGEWEISAPGYFAITITPRDDSRVYLQPVEQAAEISVSGKDDSPARLLLPSSLSVLTPETTSEPLEPAQLLQRQEGILVKSYGAAGQLQQIALRGLGAEQTQFLFDGIPLNSPQLGSYDFGGLATRGEWDIYRVGSALFGGSGSIGGNINIRPLRPGESARVKYDATLGSFERLRHGVSASAPVAYGGLAFQGTWDGAQNNYTPPGGNVKLQNRDFFRRILMGQYDFGLIGNIRANLLVRQHVFDGGSPKPFTGFNSELANRSRREEDQTLSRLRFDANFETGQVSGQIYRRNEWQNYRAPVFAINSLHFNSESGLLLRGRFALHPRLLLLGGSEIIRQHIRSSEAGKHQRDVQAVYLLASTRLWQSASGHTALSSQLSARLQTAQPGEAVLLPGAGLNLSHGDFSAWASWGRNFRQPNFNALYWQPGGNPGLTPEKSQSFEAGLQGDHVGGFFRLAWNAVYYNTRVKDNIRWLPQGSVWSPRNLTRIKSEGLETAVTLSDKNNRHMLRGAYSFTNARKTSSDFSGDQTAGNMLPLVPKHQYSLQAGTAWGAFSAGATWQFMSFRYANLDNNPRDVLDAQATLDAWISYAFSGGPWQVSLTPAASNITDEAYAMVNGYPMPGQTFSLKFSLQYQDQSRGD